MASPAGLHRNLIQRVNVGDSLTRTGARGLVIESQLLPALGVAIGAQPGLVDVIAAPGTGGDGGVRSGEISSALRFAEVLDGDDSEPERFNCHCTAAVMVGAAVFIERGFDATRLLRLIQAERITQIFGLPMMYRQLLDHPDIGKTDLSSLRRALYAMATMPEAQLRRCLEVFRCDFYLLFGQTEMSPTATLFRPEHQLSQAGAVGTPVVNVQAAIMDADGTLLPQGTEGEIVYRGPHTLTGYLDNAEATDAAFAHGWFHSGDIGRFDADGILWFTDRRKDVLEATHDPFLAAALGAQLTSRVEFGTSIAVAFARSPMTVAVAANDLQLMSQGRFLLGLGSQIKAHITRRFSMPWSHPAPRMREYILAVRAIWASWHDSSPLNFEGEFYRHTLMTPMFDPGPNPFGNPPVLLAGVGEAMTAVAGEVADGFICHGFTTKRYLREVTLPALERGRQRAGLPLAGYEVAGMPFVVTGATEEEFAAAKRATKEQIAFYASTPAYRAVLELHGWGELQDELTVMSKAGRWKDMADLIDDAILDAIAVVAEPGAVAAEIGRRYGDVFTRMSLYLKVPLADDVLEPIVAELRD